MNSIKYVHATTGEMKIVRCIQPSYATISELQRKTAWMPHTIRPRHGVLSEIDELMRKRGFVRAGNRWKRKSA